eukprot:gene43661-1587_t
MGSTNSPAIHQAADAGGVDATGPHPEAGAEEYDTDDPDDYAPVSGLRSPKTVTTTGLSDSGARDPGKGGGHNSEAAAPVLRGDGVKLLIGNEHRLGEKSAKDNSHLHGERWHMITLFVRLAPDQPADALKAILRVRFTAHQTVRGGNPDKDGGITEPNSADRRGFQKSMKLWGMFEPARGGPYGSYRNA